MNNGMINAYSFIPHEAEGQMGCESVESCIGIFMKAESNVLWHIKIAISNSILNSKGHPIDMLHNEAKTESLACFPE